ncbi:choice-of-anchor M domain-containing protein [Corynebacterium diphtheriae]|uniref:choice-of-anchor M domain-containing protein n=1 Tax=Corynebacterium diphtheriae TaxID=1717 RepID=UPI00038F4F9D|nr:choice-of-anchor M domain-containing protein [Corynebacterium diphtheriae]ERA54016.1 ABC transporter permease [Corynebacterium diphtheriae str. Aberdeen]KLN42792.1 ABC transporter permease [Corynebacterium diphtheriae bv. gravis str. ISS 4746]KLN44933.1 ABC transporter permease [Corynebacterium diphtheriae bv. gravis str. ISS 4749]MBG9368565.1 choice-of-anchor M domain-containing protein [Corynebacterium diphtheriae bv. gravis]MBG9379513.1 choice-of-anchor M domain-containing protein [Coryn
MAKITKVTSMLCCLAIVSLSMLPVSASEDADLDATGHKKGEPAFGVTIPKGTTYRDSDDKEVPHPCVDRKIGYQGHFDALYGTYNYSVKEPATGLPKLELMAVDGQQVVPQESLCFRLPPDAGEDGEELSRIRIPDDKEFEFLGKPGDIVWYAPQNIPFANGHRPIWAGIGAFDPHHEPKGKDSIPEHLDKDMYFELKDFSGPGDVNVFFKNNSRKEVERIFSSKDEELKTIEYEMGSHGHFNWTFSKPGIYELTWEAYVKNGAFKVKTEPVRQIWLVGSDEEVGLPKGTTTNLNKITKPLDKDVTNEPPTDPSEKKKPQRPEKGHSETSSPSALDDSIERAWKLTGTPKTIINDGHMDLALTRPDKEFVTVINREGEKYSSGDVTLTVPDSGGDQGGPLVKTNSWKDRIEAQISGSLPDQAWVLPESQDHKLPWVGFSNEDLPSDALLAGSKMTVSLKKVELPHDGRMISWHNGISGIDLLTDTDDLSKNLEYGLHAHDHQSMLFTKEGAYGLEYSFDITTASGKQESYPLHISYLVGDATIARAKEILAGEKLGGSVKKKPQEKESKKAASVKNKSEKHNKDTVGSESARKRQQLAATSGSDTKGIYSFHDGDVQDEAVTTAAEWQELDTWWTQLSALLGILGIVGAFVLFRKSMRNN